MAKLIAYSPKAIGLAVGLLGTDNMVPGTWTEPAVFGGLTCDEASAAKELLAEVGADVQVVYDPR